MNHTNHRKNAGSFKQGKDQRRNTAGQQSADAVALGALLKKYLIEEAGKQPRWGGDRGTNAQALAAEIWDQAIQGKFPFVQFLADRIMGKVQIEDTPPDALHARFAYDTQAQPK